MTTAREAFEAKMLARKYGVPGRVAGLYRSAGYNVDMVEGKAYDFIARRRGEALAVRVFNMQGKPPLQLLEDLASQAGEAGAKPILVLYGSGPRIDSEVREKARELGVSIRRVRS